MTKYLDNGGLQRFFDNLTGRFQTISQVNTLIEESASESLSNPEIAAMFMGADEIWVKVPSGWTACDVTVVNGGTATVLTENGQGYYVYDASDVSASADQFVFSDTSTNATLSIANDKAGIEAYKGKIIEVATGSATATVLA